MIKEEVVVLQDQNCNANINSIHKKNLVGSKRLRSSDEDLEFWKSSFFKLKETRSEEIEDLKSQLDVSKKYESRLQRLVAVLEEQNSSLKAKLCSIQSDKEKVDFYERMLCSTIKFESNDEVHATIRNSVNQSAVQFFLKEKDGSLTYRPSEDREKFPDYLRSEIQGEVQMAPIIFADIIQNLYDE